MGLLGAAYRTYQTQAHRAGVAAEGEREPLTPVSHIVQNAQLEITISDDGAFLSAQPVPKDDAKTIIPATIESANRTAPCPHPLCDQLTYLLPDGGKAHKAYVDQLAAWAGSAFSHIKVRAVLAYVKSGSILADLTDAGLIEPEDKPEKYGKLLVRWRVLPKPEDASAECWRDQTLFDSFARFYAAACEKRPRDVCMLSGQPDIFCETHQKGVVALHGNAKLISSKDSAGFAYHGRFAKASEAFNVGYTSSQMAHSALRWVAANHGVMMGSRMFLCWNPEGRPVPAFALFGLSSSTAEKPDLVSYRKNLLETLGGYRQKLRPEDDVVVAALDAATTGRLSVTYYNELRGSDFLDRIEHWYDTCCWDSSRYGVQAPSLRRIVSCAFGTEQGEFIKADDRVLREHVQRLLLCILDRARIPVDIIRALVTRAGMPQAYTRANRETLLDTACTVIRKYRIDKKEEWDLALDTLNPDRSYLFGRLLAVAEHVERSTYGKDEGRETNAIRMQTVFAQRPMYAWRIIEERLNPYFARLTPSLRGYYKNLIGGIAENLDLDDPALNSPLDDVYLLGYYHQRTALFTKKENI